MESSERNLLIQYREQQLVQPSVLLWLCQRLPITYTVK